MTVRRRRKLTWVWSCRCERCGYAWTTLGDEAPGRCPGCKAHGFDKARPYRRGKAKK